MSSSRWCMNIRRINWRRWPSSVAEVTVAQCLRRSAELTEVSDSPRLDVELLLVFVLQRRRTWLYTWPETALTEAQLALFEAALARRCLGEPLAHITGEREFWSLPLRVNSSTLIPRPDSELLVELALALTGDQPKGRALDLGTGTGALALAFASERRGWEVTALDASPEAVALAEENRRRLDLEQVHCACSDWYSALEPAQLFDLIMSNPPYIADNDVHLSRGDVRFEPRSALVAERDGLADIEHIVDRAPGYLVSGGWLLVEHGWEQAEAVGAIFERCGFQSVRTEQDLNGRDRVTLGRWSGEKVREGDAG